MNPKISDSLVDLSPYYGIVRVSGVGAAAFLQGQLSANLQALLPGSHQFSAYCNLKGRIRALLRIWRLGSDSYAFMLARSILPQTLKVLADYGRFSKIKLEDCSTQYAIWGLLGAIPEALQALPGMQLLALPDVAVPRFIAVVPADTADTADTADYQDCSAMDNPSVIASTAKQSRNSALLTGLLRACGPRNDEEEHDSQFFRTNPLLQWHALDIRAGIPDIAPQSIALFLPHHLGPTVLAAISFDKGCFCGQEVIARMHYRSTPKRQLAYLQAADDQGPPPAPGTLLYAEKDHSESIGVLVQAVHLETLEALITIQTTHLSLNRLYLEAASGERRVLKILLPLRNVVSACRQKVGRSPG